MPRLKERAPLADSLRRCPDESVRELIESGSITPVIDRTYPLTDAAAAVRLAEEGSPAGKVVVVVEPPPPRLPPR